MTRLAARGLMVDLQILDNKASAEYKEAITKILTCPTGHALPKPDCTIRTFKDHFLVILAGINLAFPPYL